MGGRHHAFAAAPLDFLRGTDIKPDPDIMYAINRTATIALPMSNQLNRNVFEQWYETATSLTKIRNVLITQMQPCRSRGRRAPQLPSAKLPLRSESDLTALLTSSICRPGSVGGFSDARRSQAA
jgi:hypothetical protein